MPETKKWSDIKCECVDEKEYKSNEIYDERFGDIKLMTPKKGSDKKIFRKDYMTNSQKEAHAHICHLEERQKLHHKNMSTLLGFTGKNKKDFCNNHYEISAYYTYPSSCARTWDDAAGKKGGLKPVTHKDLTHMVYQLLAVEDHLNGHHLNYQDVRPTHVGIRNFDKSEYELVDRLRYPMEAEEVNTNHMLYGQLLYCSPLLFEFVALKSKKKCNDCREKSDVFSIGMTILTLGLDHSVQDCYNMKTKKFDCVKLAQYINDFDHKFCHENKLLCDITRYCLEVNECDRYNACQLLERIECYDNVNGFLRQVAQHFVHAVHHEPVVHHQPVTEVCHVEAPKVVHHEPVRVASHVHHEPVRVSSHVHHEPSRVSHHHHAEPVKVASHVHHKESTVHADNRTPVAVYRIVDGERVLQSGTPVETMTSSHAHSTVLRSSHREPVTHHHHSEVRTSGRRVVEAPKQATVVRSSHRQEPTVVRRSHVEGSSRVVKTDNTHSHVGSHVGSHVVRTSGKRVTQAPVTRTSHVQGNVTRVQGEPIRSSRVVEGGVTRVQGSHSGHSGVMRRVEGPTTTTGTVRRVEGHPEGAVRRVESHPEGAVRRVSGDAHSEGVVRRVSGDSHVEGVVRRVSGDSHPEGVVRRVSGHEGEGVVRKVSGDNVSRKVSGEHVERRLSGESTH